MSEVMPRLASQSKEECSLNPNDRHMVWLESVAAEKRFGARDKLGTANYIDAAARRRAVEAMKTGTSFSLARPLEAGNDENYYHGYFKSEAIITPYDGLPHRPPFSGGPVAVATDVAHIAAHGQHQTHLDALNHIGRHGKWYNGWAIDDPAGPDLTSLTDHGLFTRGVLADIPAVRGTDWVDAARPVTGEDIDAALAAAGVTFQPGDALLLYMGRDKYEAAGYAMDQSTGEPMPGAGSGAARWLVEHQASMICWDFIDAVAKGEPSFPVHMLIWATGLAVLDNTNYARVIDSVRRSGVITGALVVAPPPIPGATGSLVDPLFIQ
jgi:kynurenine formamidase